MNIRGHLLGMALAAVMPLIGQPSPDIEHVFLVDVSGSMRSTLGPPSSEARAFLARNLWQDAGVFRPSQTAMLRTFTVPGFDTLEHRGSMDAKVLERILLERMPISNRDTDLRHALQVASAAAGKKLTLAWILTDNANDPKGTGADIENTRQFYGDLFQGDRRVRRVYFFPIGQHKLVLYLLLISPDPALNGLDIDAFEDRLTAFGRRLGAPRIRVKPVGGESPLEIDRHLTTQVGSGVWGEVIGSGTKAEVIVHGLKEGQPLAATFQLRLRSRFDEWRIETAHVESARIQALRSDDFENIEPQMSAGLSPTLISADPRGVSVLTYSLSLGSQGEAPTPKAAFFHAPAFLPDSTGIVNGRLVVRIGSPKLRFKIFNDDATTRAVRSIFHLEDIEYFVPRAAADQAIRLDMSLPLRFEVKYDFWPRLLAVCVVGPALIILLALLLLSRRRPLRCRLEGYQNEPFALLCGRRVPLSSDSGTLAWLSRDALGRVVCRPEAGVLLNGKPQACRLGNGSALTVQKGEIEYPYRLELLNTDGMKPDGGTEARQYY
jgi:hypothetical protein